MTSLVKRKQNGKILYYLKYSSRGNSRQKYLGTRIPKNINKQKIDFELKCYREEKYIPLEKIHQNYSKHITEIDKKIIKDENHGFKITHTYATQKIEGSTMTLSQTRNLLENGLSPKDTTIEDIIEAQQISEIFDELLITNNDVTLKLILHWHDTLFAKTDTNNAGNFRRQDVAPYFGKTQYVLWSDVSQDMSNLVKWYNKEKKTINPVELAAQFHYSFEMIHPFIDGNGRIGRLLINFILYKNNYPMSNVELKEKTSYINKLELSYVKNDNIIFVKWFVSKYLRDHKKFLK